MGATRFDVAVRALRGELDPPEWVENTERSSGIILSALYQFPRMYTFQVVGKAGSSSSSGSGAADGASGAGSSGKDEFVKAVVGTVSRVAQAEVEDGKVEVKERMGGKYVSVSVDVMTRAPEIVGLVYDELGKDPRVMMRF
ncbi:hypothetical protein CHLRE_12g532000v5 [Chlamydomonas reinhardtii]|uniref:Uncharacterized protein n=1 Tax=Chlamydomonas reinhardtii TaxID=3055 RepID=A0A2K3D4V9_CHLRE|nr:uncharacterized protein CHLRE_12g532000v5 [Chlamydomonas reinhardtii]PNW75570.1 hypothetical protein CHLRE_12g532000v5 [Chlamydomonas reinhardtii]